MICIARAWVITGGLWAISGEFAGRNEFHWPRSQLQRSFNSLSLMCLRVCAYSLSLFIVTVTAKYFMVFVFPFQSLKFLCSNHMMLLWLFFARLPLGPGAKKDGCFRRLIFCGYVFPRTVNETKKAIILCISYHLYERVQENHLVIVNVSSC